MGLLYEIQPALCFPRPVPRTSVPNAVIMPFSERLGNVRLTAEWRNVAGESMDITHWRQSHINGN